MSGKILVEDRSITNDGEVLVGVAASMINVLNLAIVHLGLNTKQALFALNLASESLGQVCMAMGRVSEVELVSIKAEASDFAKARLDKFKAFVGSYGQDIS